LIKTPPPPPWLTEASLAFLRHIAQPLYWLLFVAAVFTYLVLRWQRRPHETPAARGLRWKEAGKAFLWLSLGIGRLFGDWQVVLWAVAVLVAALSVSWWLIALFRTYVVPSRSLRRPVANDILPPYPGTERRSGNERRTGWRNMSQ
jgi:hypothetical protein